MKKTDSQQKASETPFFARFLETQEMEQASGGWPYVTHKYPSDNDDDGPTS